MIPSSADLAYFIEVADTLNVSRASERLGISQPSLSLALQRLEQAVGVPLLIRSKRGVSLTQAGKQLLAQAKHLQQTWEEVRGQALASVSEIQGSYTIGCHPSVGLFALSGFLPKLVKDHPKLNISLKHDLSRKITEEVISMKVDVGIVVNPVQHPDLVIHPLCADEVTLWTSKNGQGVPDVLICDPDLGQSQSLMKQFRQKGIKFNRIITCGSLEVIADLVASGCGAGILPSRAILVGERKLKRVPKAPAFHDDHALIFRMENRNVRSIQVINEAIKAFFEKSQAGDRYNRSRAA